MSEVEMLRLPGLDHEVATVWSEAGVVTQRVADAAERGGFVLFCVLGDRNSYCSDGIALMMAH